MAKKSKNGIIAAIVIILVVILLIYFVTKSGSEEVPVEAPAEVPAEEPAAPAETVVEAPVEPVAAPVAEEVTASGEKIDMADQTGIEVTEEYISYHLAGGQPSERTDGESWFSAITCQHAVLEEGEKSAEKLDKLSFKLVNKGNKDYVLRYVKYGDPDFDDALRVQINGRRVRDVDVACGKDTLAAGETLLCANADAYLREGESYTGKDLVNSLSSETTHYKSKIVFKC